MSIPLPHWFARRQPWRDIADQVNRIVEQVNTDAALTASEGMELRRLTGGGAAVSVLNNAASRLVVVKITATEEGGGKYAGHLFTGNSTAQASQNISLSEGLTDTNNNNALVVNLAEAGCGASHRLVMGSYHAGLIVGKTARENSPRAIVLIRSETAAVFAVQVSKDGGADGTATTPASWTYTVKTVDDSITLGTGVVLARPRPNGSMVVWGASPAFGLAFYDANGTLRLWDAGEIPATAACS